MAFYYSQIRRWPTANETYCLVEQLQGCQCHMYSQTHRIEYENEIARFVFEIPIPIDSGTKFILQY